MLRPFAVVVAVATLCGVAAGCTADDEAARPDTGCAATVRDASFAIEADEQVALLDLAMARCASYGALVAEMEQYPGIVGYEIDAFVERRCTTSDDDAVTASAACRAFTAPSTTLADAELVFVGQTLDGRVVEIRPDADTVFVDGVPEVVQRTVDIASEAGCDGVYEQRDRWAARAEEPGIGDEASVYAVHAQNVANYIGCEPRPLPGGTLAPDATPTTPATTAVTPATTAPAG